MLVNLSHVELGPSISTPLWPQCLCEFGGGMWRGLRNSHRSNVGSASPQPKGGYICIMYSCMKWFLAPSCSQSFSRWFIAISRMGAHLKNGFRATSPFSALGKFKGPWPIQNVFVHAHSCRLPLHVFALQRPTRSWPLPVRTLVTSKGRTNRTHRGIGFLGVKAATSTGIQVSPPANPSWRIIRSRHLQHGMMLALTSTSCGRRAHAFASTTFSSPAPKFRLHMLRHISQVAVASRGRTFRTPCWPTGNLPSQPYLLQPPHRWPWPWQFSVGPCFTLIFQFDAWTRNKDPRCGYGGYSEMPLAMDTLGDVISCEWWGVMALMKIHYDTLWRPFCCISSYFIHWCSDCWQLLVFFLIVDVWYLLIFADYWWWLMGTIPQEIGDSSAESRCGMRTFRGFRTMGATLKVCETKEPPELWWF